MAHGDAQLARVRLDADFFDAFASPCEADAGRGERRFRELPDRQALAGSEDERARLGMLEHPMHAVDIFLGVAPVPDRVEVSQPQHVLLAELDARNRVRYLARHELPAAQRRLVVEENAAHRVQAVGLTEVHGHPVRVHFGDAVRATRRKRSALVLRDFGRVAEHLRGRGLVDARAKLQLANRLQHVQCAAARDIGGGDRLHERRADEALRCQVVNLVRLVFLEQAHARAEVRQVMLDELQPLVVLDAEVGEPPEIDAAAAPEGSDYDVTELEQPFGEIGSVLPRDSSDQRFFGHSIIPFMRAESCTSARPNPLRHA